VESLMTSMQSLKMVIENACRVDWSHVLPQPTVPPTPRKHLTPQTSQQLLSEEDLFNIGTILIKSLAESVQRRAIARAEAITDEDYDAEQEEFDMMKGAEEEEIQFNIAELIGSILKTHGSLFLPVLIKTQWLDRLNDFSHEHSLLSDRKIAAYVFCDIVEYCDDAAVPLLDLIMPSLLRGVDSDEPTLRQPCAYGVGISASKLTHTQWVEHALQHLSMAASKAGARQGEQESATDNVVAAIGTICIQLSDHQVIARDGDRLWDQYLNYLPLRSDVEESSKVTLQLCRLTRSNHGGLLGDQMKRLPKVFTLMASAIGQPGTTPFVLGEIAQTVSFLSTAMPADQMNQLWSMLPHDVAQRARAL
jgi:importin-5